MFEEIALSAVKTLLFIFWSSMVFMIIWGALWTVAMKK